MVTPRHILITENGWVEARLMPDLSLDLEFRPWADDQTAQFSFPETAPWLHHAAHELTKHHFHTLARKKPNEQA